MSLKKLTLFAEAGGSFTRAKLQAWFLREGAPALAANSMVRRCIANIFDLTPKDPMQGVAPDLPSRPNQRSYDIGAELWYDDSTFDARGLIAATLADRVKRCDLYETTEWIRIDYAVPRQAGMQTPGLKFVILVEWRTDISVREAREYWRRHVGLVRWAHPTSERYIQDWVEKRADDTMPHLDAIAGLHSPTIEAFETGFYAGRPALDAVRLDIKDYIKDVPARLYASEHVIKA